MLAKRKALQMEITMVRHGEIEGAGSYVYYGATDYPLSDRGREQAKEAGRRLRGETFDAIIASPLSRAKETAALLCREAGLDGGVVTYDKRLQEMDFGAFEGYTYDRLSAERPDLAQRMADDWLRCAFDGGESPEQFHARVTGFISDLLAHDWKKVLLVAHGGTIRSAGSALLGCSPDFFWRLKSDHCRISRIEVADGYGMIRVWNG